MAKIDYEQIQTESGTYKTTLNKMQRDRKPWEPVNPKLILADEPTGALDSKSSTMLLETMETMNREMAATILMVTHDAFSASYCNRILFLSDGEVFQELYKGTQTRRAFLNEILDVLSIIGGDGHA